MFSQKQTLLVASAFGVLGVSLGAFGAHVLKSFLIASGRIDTYELAVRYHFYHTLALLAVAILMDKYSAAGLRYSAVLFAIGIVLFSGSLYAICLLNTSSIAIITPIGGIFLISGWIALFISVVRNPAKN